MPGLWGRGGTSSGCLALLSDFLAWDLLPSTSFPLEWLSIISYGAHDLFFQDHFFLLKLQLRRKSIERASKFEKNRLWIKYLLHLTICPPLASAVETEGWDLCLFGELPLLWHIDPQPQDINCLLKYQSAVGFPSAFAYRIWVFLV